MIKGLDLRDPELLYAVQGVFVYQAEADDVDVRDVQREQVLVLQTEEENQLIAAARSIIVYKGYSGITTKMILLTNGNAYLSSEISNVHFISISVHRKLGEIVVLQGSYVLLVEFPAGKLLDETGFPHKPIPNNGTLDTAVH